MRDPSRAWRKPMQRENTAAVRERIERARERMEQGIKPERFFTIMPKPPITNVLDVCCEALYTALLVYAWDRESAQDVVAEALCLLRAERDCRERGE